MVNKKLEQFHQENSTWLRTLDFMEQEHAFMKQRLSKVVESFGDPDLLEWAENCQNQLIMKDEAIHLLKKDIATQEKRLANEYLFHSAQLKNDIISVQQQLRGQMEYMENDFFMMKKKFNQYLTQKVMHA